MTTVQTYQGMDQLQADVILVTVTKVEASAVLGLMREKYNRDPKVHYIRNKTFYDLGYIGGARICMVRSEMGVSGPGGAITTILDGITQLSPSSVIMVGIAFGVAPEEQSVGDILVSRQIVGYELQRVSTGKNNEPAVKLRGERALASPRLLDRFRDGELNWDGAKVSFGLVLSGEKLVDNLNFRNQLLELEPEAIGGEMEGTGLYAVSYLHKVDWILVKAICDWADGDKSKNKSENQELAAQNATRFLFHIMERGGLVENKQIVTRAAVQDEGSSTFVTELTAEDYSNAEELIKRHCEQKWGDNYSMRVYCEDKQREAVKKLQRGGPDNVPLNVFMQIRAKTAQKSPQDYTMRVYYEDKEINAFIALQQGGPSDVPQEVFARIRANCAVQWPQDYSMRLYCESKELAAFRKLRT